MSAVFGGKSAKVPRDDYRVQGIACLDSGPVWNGTRGCLPPQRRYLLPVIAIFGAQDDSTSAGNPGDLFGWRGARHEIGRHAAGLRLPCLTLVAGVLDAPTRA